VDSTMQSRWVLRQSLEMQLMHWCSRGEMNGRMRKEIRFTGRGKAISIRREMQDDRGSLASLLLRLSIDSLTHRLLSPFNVSCYILTLRRKEMREDRKQWDACLHEIHECT
jgi:hypothetical protein